jgi:hypothetical protein
MLRLALHRREWNSDQAGQRYGSHAFRRQPILGVFDSQDPGILRLLFRLVPSQAGRQRVGGAVLPGLTLASTTGPQAATLPLPMPALPYFLSDSPSQRRTARSGLPLRLSASATTARFQPAEPSVLPQP